MGTEFPQVPGPRHGHRVSTGSRTQAWAQSFHRFPDPGMGTEFPQVPGDRHGHRVSTGSRRQAWAQSFHRFPDTRMDIEVLRVTGPGEDLKFFRFLDSREDRSSTGTRTQDKTEVLWRPCSFTPIHSLTGPVGQPFASCLGGQRFASMGCTHTIQWNGVLLLANSRYSSIETRTPGEDTHPDTGENSEVPLVPGHRAVPRAPNVRRHRSGHMGFKVSRTQERTERFHRSQDKR
jgi:hypothetical protein